MAFTPQERNLIKNLKEKGYTSTQVAGFIGGQRTNKTSSIQQDLDSATNQTDNSGGFMSTVKDIPSDISEAFKGSVNSVSDAFVKTGEIRNRVESGETTPVSGTLQTIGAGLRAGAETVGQSVIGAAKTLFSPKREQAIKQTVSTGIEKIAETKPVQAGIDKFQSLDPETQRNIEGGLGVVEGIGTLTGFAPVVNKFRKVIGNRATSLLNKSDDFLKKTKADNVAKTSDPTTLLQSLDSALKDTRLAISDIDPQLETVLKNTDFNEVNTFFQQAKNAVKDPSKPTPFAIVGNKGVEAFDSIKGATINAVKGKKAILEKVQTKKIPKTSILESIQPSIQSINDKFGIKLSNTGRITKTAGRLSQLDKVDSKLITEYFQKFNSIGSNPTIKQIDDFVDWSQGQLYKQSKTLSKLDTASDPVVSQLRQTTGQINGLLKENVKNGYGEVNARISSLLELQDELSRGLGAEGLKGSSFVKRLFSPSGENTRRIFERIKTETGVDLFKESTLAKFAMESVGDARQKSLLQKLDVELKNATELDLTRPLTIVRFIRERADLDGQELANELLKRINQPE